jgi:hypothetical protein
LRRALPIGCRRRFVAEVREHFASAVAAEAEGGVGRVEAEQLTIERLGPARALADQVLADLRSGALGRRGELAVALTAKRLVAIATLLTIAAVAASVLVGRRSASPPPEPRRATGSPVIRMRKDVATLVLTLQANIQTRYAHSTPGARDAKPAFLYLTPVP